MLAEDRGELALVMSGGGARAAYQVGFLRSLVRRHPTLRPTILTGVSAGAINAACLAAVEGRLLDRVEHLTEIWRTLTTEKVFHVESGVLAANVLRSGLKLV
jgi:NTE family protein